DDVFHPDKLRIQCAALDIDPDLAFVFSYCGVYEDRRKMIQEPALVRELYEAGEKSLDYWRFQGQLAFRLLVKHVNYAMGYPGFVFRRRDWERKGGLDEKLRISSDYDLLCWLALHGDAALIPGALYYRRDHKDNLCKRAAEVFMDTFRVKAR